MKGQAEYLPSCAQNPNISNRLEKNAFLTVWPVFVIKIPVAAVRLLFDIRPYYIL